MKTLNLYFDAEFTSLSPDAQLISLGIVSDEYLSDVIIGEETVFGGQVQSESNAKHINNSKSFYAEFSDFDINRCDDWVKENVVKKLKYYPTEHYPMKEEITSNLTGCSHTETVKYWLKQWLSQFSDYNLQFVADCSTYDWFFLVQLLAEWDEISYCLDCGKIYPNDVNTDICECNKGAKHGFHFGCIETFKTGLQKLPANISPVCFDLNDLIAIKKGITPKEAFDLNRESLMVPFMIIDETTLPEIDKEELLAELRKTGPILFRGEMNEIKQTIGDNPKHNSLWDAKVIKEIYNKLK